ncbi:HNH endonuclease [Streptomyces sp. NPDC048508]|uniref:HNH endonuclease n=1 Tax=Streptomyces sp. NPDC048508 TaxID=3365561 RepID=UPI00371FF32A
MAKHTFSATERYAVFTVHGGRCYMCRDIVDMATFQVDHVIPESLADSPAQLEAAKEQLGRPARYELNSYENWLPACVRCNNLKWDRVWDPSLLVQLWLQRAADRAAKARAHAKETIHRVAVTKALNLLERAVAADRLTAKQKQCLEPLVENYSHWRSDDSDPQVVRLTPTYEAPLLEVLSDNESIRVVRGPYGVGGGPSPNRQQSAAPPCSCGSYFFNGARCVVCGQLDAD